MSKLTSEQFLKDVKDHKLTIHRDEGVYRHIRLAKPETTDMHFDLITWPGYLCYTGDMGTYVFTRLRDMFEFFRRPETEDWYRINLRYWAEKCESRDRDGIMEFSEEKFKRAILEHLVEWIRGHRHVTTQEERRDLWDAVMSDVINADGDQGGYRKQIAAHDFHHQVTDDVSFYFSDFFEVCVEDFTERFRWCCYAIAWGIQQYDKAKEVAATSVEGVAA